MDLIRLFQPESITVYLLVAIRVSAAMAAGPLAAWPGVPLPARIFLGLGIALAIAPVAATAVPREQITLGPSELLHELALGLLLGVASTLLVAAVQFAAGLLDFQSGFTFGSTFDPLLTHQAGPLERFLSALGAVLFLELNGHHLFLFALGDLFQIAPVGGTPSLVGPAEITAFLSAIVVAAFAIALPFVTLFLMVDVALALLSRAAPQFNLFAVGLPIRSAMGVVALALVLPVTAAQFGALFSQLPNVLTMLFPVRGG